MNTVLAIETTSEVCSVALGYGRNILAESRIVPRRHNEFVLKMINRLINTSGKRQSDLKLVTFSCGPGSFTGVRLGAAIAQGIAFGLGINVIPVPTSAAMAHRVRKLFPEISDFTLRRKSHKGWVYVASYRTVDSRCECVVPDRLVNSEEYEFPEQTIGDYDVNLSAEDVLEVAYDMLDSQVEPQFALPHFVEGDSPYVARAPVQNNTNR